MAKNAYKNLRKKLGMPLKDSDLDFIFTHNSLRSDTAAQELWRKYENVGDGFLTMMLRDALFDKPEIDSVDRLTEEVKIRTSNEGPYMAAIARHLGFASMIKHTGELNDHMLASTLETLIGLSYREALLRLGAASTHRLLEIFLLPLEAITKLDADARLASVSSRIPSASAVVAAPASAPAAGAGRRVAEAGVAVSTHVAAPSTALIAKCLAALAKKSGEEKYVYLSSFIYSQLLAMNEAADLESYRKPLEELVACLAASELEMHRSIAKIHGYSLYDLIARWANKMKHPAKVAKALLSLIPPLSASAKAAVGGAGVAASIAYPPVLERLPAAGGAGRDESGAVSIGATITSGLFAGSVSSRPANLISKWLTQLTKKSGDERYSYLSSVLYKELFEFGSRHGVTEVENKLKIIVATLTASELDLHKKIPLWNNRSLYELIERWGSKKEHPAVFAKALLSKLPSPVATALLRPRA